MPHHAIRPGATAVITGGAAGIGLAAAERFAAAGMNVCIADIGLERIDEAAARIGETVPDAADRIMGLEADVSDRAALERLQTAVLARFGAVDLLMLNAGIQPGSALFGDPESWTRVLSVNLRGVINGAQVFGPKMIAGGRDGAIIVTGSKQGITTPPGDPAYNVSKAGVKAFAEALAHELRNTDGCNITAHLLIPGFVFTDLTRRDRTDKPDGAWTPDQTIDFMFESLERGDFYILCPDNEVSRRLDELRILWAADDIVEKRPPLSRWHADWGEAFADYLKRAGQA